MELVDVFWIRYFIFVSTVFGISSILIYGSIFQKLRDWWFKYTGPLSDLMRCQLCISVWIALAIQWYVVGYIDPIMYFFLSCSAAVTSWLLGAFTQAMLWSKAFFQKIVEED